MDQKRAVKQFLAIKKYADKTSMRLAAEGWDDDWKIVIAILMSAQTRDEVTIEVAEKLFLKFPTAQKMAKAKVEDVEKTISSINYFRNKAKYIVASSKIIADKGITYDIEWLTTLPGIGRKTSNVFLNEVGAKDAIGVDTHVYRISRRMGWAKTNNPDKVEQELLALFPKKYWKHINSVLVRFGKGYGTSKKREEEILSEIEGTYS